MSEQKIKKSTSKDVIGLEAKTSKPLNEKDMQLLKDVAIELVKNKDEAENIYMEKKLKDLIITTKIFDILFFVSLIVFTIITLEVYQDSKDVLEKKEDLKTFSEVAFSFGIVTYFIFLAIISYNMSTRKNPNSINKLRKESGKIGKFFHGIVSSAKSKESKIARYLFDFFTVLLLLALGAVITFLNFGGKVKETSSVKDFITIIMWIFLVFIFLIFSFMILVPSEKVKIFKINIKFIYTYAVVIGFLFTGGVYWNTTDQIGDDLSQAQQDISLTGKVVLGVSIGIFGLALIFTRGKVLI